MTTILVKNRKEAIEVIIEKIKKQFSLGKIIFCDPSKKIEITEENLIICEFNELDSDLNECLITETYIDTDDYFVKSFMVRNCFLIKEFKVFKKYETKPSKNTTEKSGISLNEAIDVLDINEGLWKKHGGAILERTEISLTVEEPDSSEIITWSIEEIEEKK